MNNKFLAYLRPVLLLLAVAFLALLLSRVSSDDLTSMAQTLSPLWVLFVLLCITANFAFAAKRFQVMVAPQLEYLKVLEITLAGFLLNYASMVQGIGIGAKIGLMKARGVQVSRSMAGISVEILLDLLLTGIVAVIYLHYRGLFAELLSSMPALLLLLVLLLLLPLAVLGFTLLSRRFTFLRNLGSELTAVARSGRHTVIILTTVGVWVSAGLGYYCMIIAVDGNYQVSPLLAIAAICIGFITGLISLVPGGIGVREVTWAYVVSQAGVPIEVAGLLAIFYRALSILPILLLFGLRRFITETKKTT